ncbi:MAG: pelota family protein [Euryarchaeota archaeon]|nr:pelota family protein [Euryarchaeota archaeon]MDE1835354.1 pelota family protein [Euryarchaeota archaeon]MDE1880751.1 pelota family protein [Euryarchaeota archaeon]MDE2043650.1 pelota family protein [Thermoplasmata archaeon]
MRIYFQDPRTGLIKLRLETPSDLWRISRLILPGDQVGSVTSRRDPEAPSDTPAGQRDRRTVFLTVRAESVEFHEFTGHVRVTGPIVEGPFDQGRYHTLDLEEGGEVALTKSELTSSDRALLDEGKRAVDEPQVLLVCADWGESAVVRLRGRSFGVVDERTRSGSGKYDRVRSSSREKDREAFVEEILHVVQPELERSQAVVVAGPGFLKEELSRRIASLPVSKHPKVSVVPTAESGLAGVNELLRSGKAEEALSTSMAAKEAAEVERLVRALGKDGGAALGPQELRGAVEAAAVETLLVLDSKLRDPATTGLLSAAREAKTALLLVRADGEAGRRLAGLGGMGAVLRFPWKAPVQ